MSAACDWSNALMADVVVSVAPPSGSVVTVVGFTDTAGGTALVDVVFGLVMPLLLTIVLATAYGASPGRGASVSSVELRSPLDGRFGAFASR